MIPDRWRGRPFRWSAGATPPLAVVALALALWAAAGCASTRTPPSAAPEPALVPRSRPDSAQPPSDLWRDEVPPEAVETARLLQAAEVPLRDMIDLTHRLSDPGRAIPQVVRDEPWGFEIGDTHSFWVLNNDTYTFFQISARLVYSTPHAHFFLEEGVDLDVGQLKGLADRFEGQTYPTNRQFLGEEACPGVDNDRHVMVLIARDLGEFVTGCQNSMDEYSRLVYRHSNEMEIIYVRAEGTQLGDPYYDCLLAHEFAHVIQWAVDRNENTWLNEGLAELTCRLNGLDTAVGGRALDAYARRPDTQLNTWRSEPEGAAAQYGASYLYVAYLLDRFGEQAIRSLAAEPGNGLEGVDAALGSLSPGLGADGVFADWVVANLIDDPSLAEGQYGYAGLDLPPVGPDTEVEAAQVPLERQTSVGQYAADTIVLRGEGSYQVDFAGATQVRVVPASAHSGRYSWWGGRGQEGDTTLTQEFDLTGLEKATLTFYIWYDTEQDFDYAYVEASVDGEHWGTLPGRTTTNDDLAGANYGNGYTGTSQGWTQERIDLTAYAGRRVQVRFEYVTMDGPKRTGVLLDDIEIPELGYRHDAEADEGGWAAHGFVRNALVMPQEWLLQLVTQRKDGTTVERLRLEADQTGRWAVELGPGERAILVISGCTRVTTEPAEYWYRITAADG
jgi:immune inhibitor A